MEAENGKKMVPDVATGGIGEQLEPGRRGPSRLFCPNTVEARHRYVELLCMFNFEETSKPFVKVVVQFGIPPEIHGSFKYSVLGFNFIFLFIFFKNF